MVGENISQEFRLKYRDKTHTKACTASNYIERLLIFASAVTGCLSISGFATLVSILIRITSSAVGLKIGAITAGIKI